MRLSIDITSNDTPKERYYTPYDETDNFITRCVTNLISSCLYYTAEFTFTKEQAIEVVNRVRASKKLEKHPEFTCVYSYDKKYDMYLVEIKKKGRPKDTIRARGFDVGLCD